MYFKAFLDSLQQGEVRRELFLVANAGAREQFMKDMFNESATRGLMPIIRHSNQTMIFDQSVAMVRIAHKYIDRELAGTTWTGIHGLETLDDFEHAAAMKDILKARVRP